MKSRALESFAKSLNFSKQVADAHHALWENYKNDGLKGDTWAGVQSLIMQVLASATDLINSDPSHRLLVARESEKIYSVMGTQWIRYEIGQRDEGVDPEFVADFAELISCAIDVMGMPNSLNLYNLIGINSALNEKIAYHIISYHLTSCGININSRGYEDEDPETTNFNRLNGVISRMSESESVNHAVEMLEALSILHANAPELWRGDAMFELGVNVFHKPLDLTNSQGQFFSRYFANLKLPHSQLNQVQINANHLLNMARSGLEHVAEPLLKSSHEYQNQIYIENDLVFLVDIERQTSIDVNELVQNWANLYNTSNRHMQPLRIVLGYQLLTASPTIQENLIRFSTDGDYQPISSIVGADLSREINSRDYPVNQAHLKTLVAEFMAQRPGAVENMAKDPNLNTVVTQSPGWLTHRLESDLGL
ncbi:hypothetical protein RBE51_21335 [Pseudomonas taiwanensis]|uniref:hypothetical protein n=1 Tax=Pseudomonas taiwanensis TaxID=470150 RepID=UPI0028DE8693|nr:hypothetical protein [Pseudomonas taiwanensis]MDT8925342.1 hypothetical protein [Pseudomonas taiwanensis]